jgi:hypothetical protein
MFIWGWNPNSSNVTRCLQVLLREILLVALGKSEDKYGAESRPVSNHRAIAARSSLSWPRNTLLDQSAAKVGVNQTALSSCDCLPQAGVSDEFVAGESREPLRHEDLHGLT